MGSVPPASISKGSATTNATKHMIEPVQRKRVKRALRTSKAQMVVSDHSTEGHKDRQPEQD